MTLNGVIALILRFSPSAIALLANYVIEAEDRPIMSAKYCLRVPVFQFWPKLTHPAARSLCNSWATCIQQSHKKSAIQTFVWFDCSLSEPHDQPCTISVVSMFVAICLQQAVPSNSVSKFISLV